MSCAAVDESPQGASGSGRSAHMRALLAFQAQKEQPDASAASTSASASTEQPANGAAGEKVAWQDPSALQIAL